jgi:hypothetical protein
MTRLACILIALLASYGCATTSYSVRCDPPVAFTGAAVEVSATGDTYIIAQVDACGMPVSLTADVLATGEASLCIVPPFGSPVCAGLPREGSGE